MSSISFFKFVRSWDAVFAYACQLIAVGNLLGLFPISSPLFERISVMISLVGVLELMLNSNDADIGA